MVHVKGALAVNDTTIVFYNWGGGVLSTAGNDLGPKTPGNILTYSLSFAPTSISYDDALQTTSTGVMSPQTIIEVIPTVILPVIKIINFNAQQHPGYNTSTLVLNTAANSILERAPDGINFVAIGTMVLQSSTNTQKTYTFNDNSPLVRNNSYRAKIDKGDGTFIYSKIIKINSQPAPHFAIVTNPVQSRLQVNTQDAAGKNIRFGVYDMNQRPILSRSAKNPGTLTNIDLPALSPGLYMLQITADGEEPQNIKFIIH